MLTMLREREASGGQQAGRGFNESSAETERMRELRCVGRRKCKGGRTFVMIYPYCLCTMRASLSGIKVQAM
jgi:hypothetical protein